MISSSTSRKIKILLVKTILRPIYTFGAPIWSNASPTSINKVQIMQNKCLRLALGKDRYTTIRELHDEANIPTVKDYVETIAKKFYAGTVTHENRLIQGIISTRGVHHKHKLSYEHLPIYHADLP